MKRRIVEETLVAGASVAVIARRHGVNANQVFTWRRQYRAGQLEATRVPALAAVKIVAPAEGVAGRRRAGGTRASSGTIEIEFGADVRLRVMGAPAAATIAACVRALRAR